MVEIVSSKEDLNKAKVKMDMWMNNGCKVAWLIDTFDSKIYVYEEGESIYTHHDYSKELKGSKFLSDFSFIPNEVFSE